MNERILKLAKEAGLSYIPSSNNGPLRVEYLFPELEKFAELIVAECLSVIEEMNPHDPERNIDDIFDEVDEHFGVE